MQTTLNMFQVKNTPKDPISQTAKPTLKKALHKDKATQRSPLPDPTVIGPYMKHFVCPSVRSAANAGADSVPPGEILLTALWSQQY